jgi:hypothetical protein
MIFLIYLISWTYADTSIDQELITSLQQIAAAFSDNHYPEIIQKQIPLMVDRFIIHYSKTALKLQTNIDEEGLKHFLSFTRTNIQSFKKINIMVQLNRTIKNSTASKAIIENEVQDFFRDRGFETGVMSELLSVFSIANAQTIFKQKIIKDEASLLIYVEQQNPEKSKNLFLTMQLNPQLKWQTQKMIPAHEKMMPIILEALTDAMIDMTKQIKSSEITQGIILDITGNISPQVLTCVKKNLFDAFEQNIPIYEHKISKTKLTFQFESLQPSLANKQKILNMSQNICDSSSLIWSL